MSLCMALAFFLKSPMPFGVTADLLRSMMLLMNRGILRSMVLSHLNDPVTVARSRTNWSIVVTNKTFHVCMAIMLASVGQTASHWYDKRIGLVHIPRLARSLLNCTLDGRVGCLCSACSMRDPLCCCPYPYQSPGPMCEFCSVNKSC